MASSDEENLTLSDWIAYLSGESNPAIGNFVAIAAFFLAALAIVFETNKSTNGYSWIGVVEVVVFVIVLIILIAKIFEAHAGRAEDLLELIMSGKLKNPLYVRTLWQARKIKRKEWEFLINEIIIEKNPEEWHLLRTLEYDDKRRTSSKCPKMHRRIFTRNKGG